jgi:hypothetical protein
LLSAGLVLSATVLLCACGAPNQANIELRKKNQSLGDQIVALQRDRDADQARIAGLESKIGTLPTLPESRLDKLYTARAIRLGTLTGGADLDPNKPGDEGIRVDLEPLDDSGAVIKATGAASIEAIDMATDPPQRIGKWDFTPQQLKQAWRSFSLVHDFVLECPWQGTVPSHSELAVKVDFTDELTQRKFSVIQKITVQLAPTTQPGERR